MRANLHLMYKIFWSR